MEHLREAANVPKRRSEIVGDRVVERLQFPVDLFQLSGALPDPVLQFFVELADLLLRVLTLGDILVYQGDLAYVPSLVFHWVDEGSNPASGIFVGGRSGAGLVGVVHDRRDERGFSGEAPLYVGHYASLDQLLVFQQVVADRIELIRSDAP